MVFKIKRKLIEHFLKDFGQRYKKRIIKLSYHAKSLLLTYDYPGNIRELEHIIQRAVLLSENRIIEPKHLLLKVCKDNMDEIQYIRLTSFKTAKESVVSKFESTYILECLKASGGNISKASDIAGINVKNFFVKMKKHQRR